MSLISIVIPVMNEAENVVPIYSAIDLNLSRADVALEFIFVCDPSTDETAEILRDLCKRDPRVSAVFLADRCGQTEAIRAGYERASGDAVISMDADFQDPPELLPALVDAWREGARIVHTERRSRKSDTFVYRNFVSFGYKILNWLTNDRIKQHVGDYRLIDAAVLRLILQFGDPHPFWRGITSLSGVQSKTISYQRPHRKAGETKYSYRIGSPAVALRGLASFSNRPLEFLQALGILSVLLSATVVLGLIFLQIFYPGFPRGIPTLIGLLAIFFSIQFASTAIIATYLIVLIEQTRKRPNYLVLPDGDS